MSRYNWQGDATIIERVTLTEVRIHIQPPSPRPGWFTLIEAENCYGNIEPGATGYALIQIGDTRSKYVFVNKEFRP